MKWKTQVPGRGQSSPVVQNGRVYVTTAVETGLKEGKVGHDECWFAEHIAIRALCLDADTGKILWNTLLFDIKGPTPVHKLNCFATPTPIIEGERLYCDFGTYGTACLDSEAGKILWQKQLKLDHQTGPGSSPFLYKGLLILVRDGRDQQYVTGLNKVTGDEVWKTNRPPMVGGNWGRKAFSTPHITGAGDSLQMIIPSAQWIASYRPDTGKEIWRYKHGRGFSIAPSPVIGDGMLYFCTGSMRPEMRALELFGKGERDKSCQKWVSKQYIPLMSTPILVGQELYWVSDAGVIACADAKTGTLHWHERLKRKFMASPIHAAGRLYFFGKDGTTTILAPGKSFKRLAENALPGTVIATPAFVDKAIFLRADEGVFRIEE